jgi:hypothetical protein
VNKATPSAGVVAVASRERSDGEADTASDCNGNGAASQRLVGRQPALATAPKIPAPACGRPLAASAARSRTSFLELSTTVENREKRRGLGGRARARGVAHRLSDDVPARVTANAIWCGRCTAVVLNLVAPPFDAWWFGEFLLSLLHNERAKRTDGEDDFAAAEATVAVMRTDHGDLIQVHPNLGSIRSRALDPSGHCPTLPTTDGRLPSGYTSRSPPLQGEVGCTQYLQISCWAARARGGRTLFASDAPRLYGCC